MEDGALAGSPRVPSQGLLKVVVSLPRSGCATVFSHSISRGE